MNSESIRPLLQSKRIQIFNLLLTLFGIYKFTSAFFLAKKSMPHVSSCDPNSASDLLKNVLGFSDTHVDKLRTLGILSTHNQDDNQANGCWMPRRVDSIAIIVVDALRFDFALEHLPLSIGSRIDKELKLESKFEDEEKALNGTINDKQKDESMTLHIGRGQSQLFQFLADPPTVTMQRLKGLTTGGLPTFADISGSFGGANVDEDSWVQQMYNVDFHKRGLVQHGKMAFVGDDTWVDLFPHEFHEAHPYPSFNTRDLDSVDNGCLKHLPRLLHHFGSNSLMENGADVQNNTYFELLVTHFLGVDHVGHTYGPHNSHMDTKLEQMDDALQTILGKIDEAKDVCQVAFIFGDHGMTEDGNHGGGSDEETHAALFAHYSPGCGDLGPSLDLNGSEVGKHSEEAFKSINQIDLVPTIALLLGLPIPFANLGGAVPALLPPLIRNENHTIPQVIEAPFVATALALNAAQVWDYLSTYSSSANKLPDDSMMELKAILDDATNHLKSALDQNGGFDSVVYREACGLYRYFLFSATDLGKKVWTKFDTFGMNLGIVILLLALFIQLLLIFLVGMKTNQKEMKSDSLSSLDRKEKFVEYFVLGGTILMHCVLLTFSNSYISAEGSIVMYLLGIICIMIALFSYLKEETYDGSLVQNISAPLMIAACARLNELFISGHGMDPSIRAHWAHRHSVFLTSLIIMVIIRIIYFNRRKTEDGKLHAAMDILTSSLLAFSWHEKRSEEVHRQGYLTTRFAMLLCIVGFFMELYKMRLHSTMQGGYATFHRQNRLLVKVILFVVTVTGPSAAASSVLFVLQYVVFSVLIQKQSKVSFNICFLSDVM